MKGQHKRNRVSNCTLTALQDFAQLYQCRTGKRLRWQGRAADLHELRVALEEAIGENEPELYSAAEQLVLALRRAPLPIAA
jgi:hypothetical protein